MLWVKKFKFTFIEYILNMKTSKYVIRTLTINKLKVNNITFTV